MVPHATRRQLLRASRIQHTLVDPLALQPRPLSAGVPVPPSPPGSLLARRRCVPSETLTLTRLAERFIANAVLVRSFQTLRDIYIISHLVVQLRPRLQLTSLQ